MLKEFNSFIIKEKLFNKEDKVLLAVSGGIDSVVMCDLFYKSKFCFDIAHCNFNLRGEESDTDQQFVIELAKKYGVIIHHKKFNTDSHSKKKGISIQMAARDLRYEWFNTLLKEKKYKCIAIAHHLDDSIETFFINILRGTGNRHSDRFHTRPYHRPAGPRYQILKPLASSWCRELPACHQQPTEFLMESVCQNYLVSGQLPYRHIPKLKSNLRLSD
jgi:tRNA(Ile)-lysidine synthetase-like protein